MLFGLMRQEVCSLVLRGRKCVLWSDEVGSVFFRLMILRAVFFNLRSLDSGLMKWKVF